MIISEIVSELLALIQSKNLDLSPILNGNGILLGGTVYNKDNIKNLDDTLPEIGEWPAGKYKLFSSEYRSVLALLITHARTLRDAPPSEEDIGSVNLAKNKDFKFKDTHILLCKGRGQEIILINKVTGERYFTDYKTFERLTLDILEKPIKDRVKASIDDVEVTYTPMLPPGFYTVGPDEKHLNPAKSSPIFNTYEPPLHRAVITCPDPKLHPHLDAYFSHLFPEKIAKDYMMKWFYTLEVHHTRTTPTVILYGAPAIGKSLLIEQIAKAFVGESNYGGDGQAPGRFTASVKNCVVHFYDEGNVKEDGKTKYKALHERSAVIEQKGVDVKKPEKIFARFVVATNNSFDVSLSWDDRKFSVPELTGNIMKNCLSPEVCNYIFYYSRDAKPAEVAEFRDWIIKNHSHNTPEVPHHGRLFKELCFESQHDWFKSFISVCEHREEITLKKFSLITAQKVSADKIKQHIFNYEKLTGIRLAEITNVSGVIGYRSLIYTGEKL